MERLHPAAQVVAIIVSGIVVIVYVLATFTNYFNKKVD
jgi:hypothetical protein